MIRVNNKGMTSIELLVCFIIISAIVVSMFDLIMNYQNKQQIEQIKNEVVSYANNLQKVIQDDLIKRHIISVSDINTVDKTATFIFDTPSTYKTYFKIDVANGIISYGKEEDVVDYEIPAIADLFLSDESNIEVVTGTNGYLKINIVLTHPNFENETYSFTINCPINFVY